MSISGRCMWGVALVVVAALGLAACGDDGGGSGDAARFCALVEEGDALVNEFEAAASPEEAEEIWSEIKELFIESVAVAPDEIRDDMDLAAGALAGITYDDRVAAGESGEDRLDTPELNESSDRVEDWQAENCTDE